MIYELRICRCIPAQSRPAVAVRERDAADLGEARHPPGRVLDHLIGKSNQEITYILAWDSMAECEKRWGAFLADPEWVEVVANTEKDGQLVENISSQLLAPVAFSAVK